MEHKYTPFAFIMPMPTLTYCVPMMARGRTSLSSFIPI